MRSARCVCLFNRVRRMCCGGVLACIEAKAKTGLFAFAVTASSSYTNSKYIRTKPALHPGCECVCVSCVHSTHCTIATTGQTARCLCGAHVCKTPTMATVTTTTKTTETESTTLRLRSPNTFDVHRTQTRSLSSSVCVCGARSSSSSSVQQSREVSSPCCCTLHVDVVQHATRICAATSVYASV